MSGEALFFDTNVLVYVHDHDEPEKQAVATRLLADHAADGSLTMSVQVLGEWFTAVTRRLARPLPLAAATEIVQRLSVLRIVPLDASVVLRAVAASQAYVISYWDALIIEAARSAGCARVLSEDLNDGQDYDGVVVENPFRRAV
jgi:predicted nucleic acid-binding protein